MLLESVISKLSGESWISAQRTTTQETRNQIEKEISSTDVKITALIGETQLTIRDMLQLKKGDVLVLDKLADSDLVIDVGGKPKYLGSVGLVGSNKSIQIKSIIDREVGEDD